MSSIEYLRSLLLADPDPFEYRLYIGAEARASVELAQAELDAATEARGRLLERLPEERRAKSLAAKSPTRDADERVAAAESNLELTLAEAPHVVLRWLPQDPDERQALIDQMVTERGGPVPATDFLAEQVAATFVGAFTPDEGVRIPIEWPEVARKLNAADRQRITGGVRSLNEMAHGHPFSRGSSGRPATSSSPA